MRQRADMPIDADLLRELLRLPESSSIVFAKMTGESTVTLTVESDDFPATAPTMPLPTVNAEFMPDDDGHAVFVNWKIV